MPDRRSRAAELTVSQCEHHLDQGPGEGQRGIVSLVWEAIEQSLREEDP